jgi:uncharacterized protein (TIGR02996 family)
MPRRPSSAVPSPRPEVLAFLRDARERPDDDTPRLVLADWLDEHGDEADQARAAHLRAQCRLAPLEERGPLWEELTQEVQDLEDQHAIGWLGPLARGGARRMFVRGLVRLWCRARWLLGRPPDLAASEAWAWVEGLEVTSLSTSRVAALAGCAALGTVAALSLELYWLVAPAAVRSLAASPHLSGLVSLTVRGYPACAVELVRSPHLSRLRSLSLPLQDLDDAFVEALAACPALASLRRLELYPNNRIGDAGARALLSSPHLPALEHVEGLAGPPGRLSPAVEQALRERFGGD